MPAIISITTDKYYGGIASSLISYSHSLAMLGIRHIVCLPKSAPICADLKAIDTVEIIHLPAWLGFHLATGCIFHGRLRALLNSAPLLLIHNARLVKALASYKGEHYLINHSGKMRAIDSAEHVIFLTKAACNKALSWLEDRGQDKSRWPQFHIIPHGFDVTPPIKNAAKDIENKSQIKNQLKSGENNQKNTRGKKPFHVISAGRFVEKKGFIDLIDAAKLLEDRQIKCQFSLYGSGALEAVLKERIDNLKLTNISIFGWSDNLADVFAEADLFCLPSRDEPFGLILGEAMKAGLPVIATDTHGPLEILNADINNRDKALTNGGVIVKKADPQALAQAIESFCLNPEGTKKAGLAARARIKTNYSLEKLAERLAKLSAGKLGA